MSYEETLNHIVNKFDIDMSVKNPKIIPNYGRDNLPELFNELGFKKGAEIGVLGGVYSEILCKGIPDLEFYGVDSWHLYGSYRDYRTVEELKKHRESAYKRLEPFNAKVIEKFSMDAVKDFEDNSLDFVYIDANHDLMHVIEDVVMWSQKVKPGGIIAGHDYFRSKRGRTRVHTIEALHAYISVYNVDHLFVLGNRNTTDPNEIRDRRRSWMFIKEEK